MRPTEKAFYLGALVVVLLVASVIVILIGVTP